MELLDNLESHKTQVNTLRKEVNYIREETQKTNPLLSKELELAKSKIKTLENQLQIKEKEFLE